MKTFSTRMCWICGRTISACGYAWISHSRKHVREGIIKEILDYDGRITFRKLPKQKSKRGEQRMKATKETKIILELDKTEASWLKDVMQNPLHDVDADEENDFDRKMRKRLFTTIFNTDLK